MPIVRNTTGGLNMEGMSTLVLAVTLLLPMSGSLLGGIPDLMGFNSSQPPSTSSTDSTLKPSTPNIVEDLNILELAEMELTMFQTGQHEDVRALLPDGWVKAWIRTTGYVRAGIDLAELSVESMDIIPDESGNRRIALTLPSPTITYSSLRDIDWGFSNNFWNWGPDRKAITLRRSLLRNAYNQLRERAEEAGLIVEATHTARELITRSFRQLGFADIRITFLK